jgi:phenylalanyl-tRNA synthetase beta chain
MHTEASHRFERGVDIGLVPLALDRAAALIVEVAGGVLAKGAIDCYPAPFKARRLTITARRTNDILGLSLDLLEIRRLLQSIGLTAETAADRDDALYVTIPFARHDLEREIDLIEEVARLNGYDRIAVTMPEGRLLCHTPSAAQLSVRRLRDAMVAAGFSEVINYSFTSPAVLGRIGLPAEDARTSCVGLLNPLTEEQSVMRTTLVPSVLESVARNLAYRSVDIQLFELRPVFLPNGDGELPNEQLRLTAAICGRRQPAGWAQQASAVDFFDIKGAAETLLAQFSVGDVVWDGSDSEPYLHPGKSCLIRNGAAVLGALGEVHPKVLERFEIDAPVFLLEIDCEALWGAAGAFAGVRPLSRFPDVYRDSAFLLDEAVTAQQLLEVVGRAGGREMEEVVLFDLYQGKGIPEGRKSMGIRVRYRSAEKTLTDEEINARHGKIVQSVSKTLGGELR